MHEDEATLHADGAAMAEIRRLAAEMRAEQEGAVSTNGSLSAVADGDEMTGGYTAAPAEGSALGDDEVTVGADDAQLDELRRIAAEARRALPVDATDTGGAAVSAAAGAGLAGASDEDETPRPDDADGATVAAGSGSAAEIMRIAAEARARLAAEQQSGADSGPPPAPTGPAFGTPGAAGAVGAASAGPIGDDGDVPWYESEFTSPPSAAVATAAGAAAAMIDDPDGPTVFGRVDGVRSGGVEPPRAPAAGVDGDIADDGPTIDGAAFVAARQQDRAELPGSPLHARVHEPQAEPARVEPASPRPAPTSRPVPLAAPADVGAPGRTEAHRSTAADGYDARETDNRPPPPVPPVDQPRAAQPQTVQAKRGERWQPPERTIMPTEPDKAVEGSHGPWKFVAAFLAVILVVVLVMLALGVIGGSDDAPVDGETPTEETDSGEPGAETETDGGGDAEVDTGGADAESEPDAGGDGSGGAEAEE